MKTKSMRAIVFIGWWGAGPVAWAAGHIGDVISECLLARLRAVFFCSFFAIFLNFLVNKKAHDHRQSIVATMEERREDEDRDEQQATVNARQHSSKEVMTGTPNKRVLSIKEASTKKQQSTKGVIVVCETKPQPRRVHKLMEQASTVQDQEEEQRIMRIRTTQSTLSLMSLHLKWKEKQAMNCTNSTSGSTCST